MGGFFTGQFELFYILSMKHPQSSRYMWKKAACSEVVKSCESHKVFTPWRSLYLPKLDLEITLRYSKIGLGAAATGPDACSAVPLNPVDVP